MRSIFLSRGFRGISIVFAAIAVTCVAACAPAQIPPTPTHFFTLNGQTLVAVPTGTPYQRPTDDPALKLDTPIVKVGAETITLGQFRERVRYERFDALDRARRLIERVGLAKLNFNTPGQNATADNLAAIFNTLSNSGAFGAQVYDIMTKESIIRQEFQARGLKIKPDDERGFWIQRLDLQAAQNVDDLWPKARDEYIQTAVTYSGLSADTIAQIADTQIMSETLRPIIGKENMPELTITTYKIAHILTKTQTDAEAALNRLKQGEDFRTVACQTSIDPTTQGNGGALGFETRSQLPVGFSSLDPLFNAKPGDLVGPLQNLLGWYIFLVGDQRKTPDGDTALDLHMIVVATETQANMVFSQLKQGSSFGALACLYSTDQNAGNGGELGYISKDKVAPEVAAVLQGSETNGLLGPIETKSGFEVISLEDRKVDVPKPADVDQAVSTAFINWQAAKASSSYVTALSDVWKSAIPTDPLPRDVSPLMQEANFGLPTVIPSETPNLR